jgi:hypothetical protein
LLDTDIWGGFLGSNAAERIKKCRHLAAEAETLAAAAANPAIRASYLELKRQWNELSDEMEHAMRATSGGVTPS